VLHLCSSRVCKPNSVHSEYVHLNNMQQFCPSRVCCSNVDLCTQILHPPKTSMSATLCTTRGCKVMHTTASAQLEFATLSTQGWQRLLYGSATLYNQSKQLHASRFCYSVHSGSATTICTSKIWSNNLYNQRCNLVHPELLQRGLLHTSVHPELATHWKRALQYMCTHGWAVTILATWSAILSSNNQQNGFVTTNPHLRCTFTHATSKCWCNHVQRALTCSCKLFTMLQCPQLYIRLHTCTQCVMLHKVEPTHWVGSQTWRTKHTQLYHSCCAHHVSATWKTDQAHCFGCVLAHLIAHVKWCSHGW